MATTKWLAFILLLTLSLQITCLHLKPRGCFDLQTIGRTRNGYYIVYDQKNLPYRVYCDFTSEFNFVYTLVASWKFSNRMMRPFRYAGYNRNLPVNEFNPNWSSYRMSKNQMEQVRNLSGMTHWRMVCNFDTIPVDYRDYLRVSFVDTDLLLNQSLYECRKVDYINIMGSGCRNCKVFMYHYKYITFNVYGPLTRSTCGFTFSDGKTGQEIRNLGYLFGRFKSSQYNPQFRCNNNQHSTTSLWFGGKRSIRRG